MKDRPAVPILYEDNHLLVVEKPVNIPSQGDSTGDDDLLSILKEDLKLRYQKPGNVFLGLVHRLDRPVGGVMVFARTSKAASRLSEQIRTRTFYKAYLAVLHGIPEKKEGELWDFLLKDSRTNTVKTVQEGTAGSKEAILEYRLLDTRENLSLVKIHLHTGRPHQIRVQFSSRGYPLYGDQRYGGKMTKPGQQLALWSAEIRCMHPTRKEEMTFRCPPPDTYPWNLFR